MSIIKRSSMKYLIMFSLFLLLTAFDTAEQRTNYYKEKYKSTTLNKKITDNFGEGCPTLYGTRNFRVVLNGVAYRGGANNFYHKTNKRDNKNPLPIDGLQNLANEGFSAAIYLYGNNFLDAPKFIISDSKKDTLKYYNNTLSNDQQIREFIHLIYSVIKNPKKGPIYLHCWNGWHQSGYASAILLMQFCGYSNEDALKYWKKNADGGTNGYDHVMKKVMNFKPLKEFVLSEEQKKILCVE